MKDVWGVEAFVFTILLWSVQQVSSVLQVVTLLVGLFTGIVALLVSLMRLKKEFQNKNNDYEKNRSNTVEENS